MDGCGNVAPISRVTAESHGWQPNKAMHQTALRTVAHRQDVRMKIDPKIITLYRYFAYAAHMRRLFRDEVREGWMKMMAVRAPSFGSGEGWGKDRRIGPSTGLSVPHTCFARMRHPFATARGAVRAYPT